MEAGVEGCMKYLKCVLKYSKYSYCLLIRGQKQTDLRHLWTQIPQEPEAGSGASGQSSYGVSMKN